LKGSIPVEDIRWVVPSTQPSRSVPPAFCWERPSAKQLSAEGDTVKCPTCTSTPLVLSERQGIEIDYCPDCRGVWLDRGELDKIIERASSAINTNRDDHDDDRRDVWKKREMSTQYPTKKKKMSSFLGDIFDVG
jgi:Zn-finger nucleic acid-binding protein